MGETRPVGEQVWDLRLSAAPLRRRWRLLAAAGGAGLVLGLAGAVVSPAQLSSTALVLLPTPIGSQNTAGQVETQVRIVGSTTVLQRAGAALKPAMTAREVEDRLSVDAPTEQLIEIRGSAGRARAARAFTQSVADAYVGVVRDTARSVSAATLSDLRTREAALSEQVKALQTEVDATVARQRSGDPTSTQGRRDGQLLAQLRAEQGNLSLQLDKVKDDIATSATLGGASQIGVSIIQPASPAVGASLPAHLLTRGLLGAVAGAFVVFLGVLVEARRTPCVRARDDFADAVGSTVLAGVPSAPQRSVAAWTALLESREVGSVEAWTFRQVLRALAAEEDCGPLGGDSRAAGRVEHPRTLTVLSLSGDERGLAVGPQLGVFAASLGNSTRLVASAGHDSAAMLWAACAAERGQEPRPYLTVAVRPPEAGAELDEDGPPADLTVVLTVADRCRPSVAGIPATAFTLLAVAPGTATREELARLAVALDDAGRRVDGIVVADPDSSDRTTGRRTLDERTRQAPLPVRLTGLATVSAPGERRIR